MDGLPGSFLYLANPDGFERVILAIFPRQRERLTSMVTSSLTKENTVDDL